MAAVGGFNMNQLAQGVLIFDLTGSPLTLGILGAATAGPTILATLFGGVLADRLDRRKLLAATQLVLAATLGLLATLVATGFIEVWHIYAIAVVSGLATGLDWPARNAMFPSLIGDKADMMSAVAMSSILWQGSRVVVPAFGGLLISAFGTATVFYIAAAAFMVMFFTLMSLRVPDPPARVVRNPFREFLEGVDYIRKTRIFAILIPLTFANMFFGMMYYQLMPAYVDIFGGGPSEIGFLFTAVGIGSVSGTFIVGKFQSAPRLGWIMLGGTFIFAIIILLFALAPSYFIAMGLAAIAGVFNSIFLISSMTVMMVRVPDTLRGRVMGIHGITFSLIPMGGLFGGLIAAAVPLGSLDYFVDGVRLAIATGAIILGALVILIAATQREIRTLDGRDLAEGG